jgi:hypothetical protein
MDTTPSYHTTPQSSSRVGMSTMSHLGYSPSTYGDPAPRYMANKPSSGMPFDCPSNDAQADKLPPYAPTLQILTLCRRKHVMKSKDRKARSRRWEVIWLLLDGTALRTYVPTSDEKKKFEKEWNEKYCAKGKQDKKAAIRSVATEDLDETDEEPDFDGPTETHGDFNLGPSTSRTLTGNNLQHRGRSSSIQKTPVTSPAQPLIRRSTLPPINAIIANVTLGPGTVLNIPVHPSLPSILSRKAHKSYPIRNATCTRPSSYFKRNFVIEFTLDGGKQFLVQLNSYEEVLTWQQVCLYPLDCF